MQNGVSKYTRATVDIFFDPEHISCAFCPLLNMDKRSQCNRTGEIIFDPRTQLGNFCPLKFEAQEESK